MPNISFHGFTLMRFIELKSQVDQTLQTMGYGVNAVTEFINSNVISCDGKKSSMPFIRVASTGNIDEIKQIIIALQAAGLNEDFEMLILDGFVQKDKKV